MMVHRKYVGQRAWSEELAAGCAIGLGPSDAPRDSVCELKLVFLLRPSTRLFIVAHTQAYSCKETATLCISIST
jgi:hypothetical protein